LKEYKDIDMTNKKAMLSQGEQRDAAVSFDTCRSLHRHRVIFTVIARGFGVEN